MIYLKSTIGGLAALFLTAAVIYLAALLAIAAFRSGGVDLPIWHVHTKSPALWLLVTVIFALGFFCEFRRLSN